MDKIRIITAASIATVCLVCAACPIRLLTDENIISPTATQIIKKASAYSIGICPLRMTLP